MNQEMEKMRVKEQASQEAQKKLSRQLRDLKEDYVNLQTKETEIGQKKSDLEKQIELSEAETVTARYSIVTDYPRGLPATNGNNPLAPIY